MAETGTRSNARRLASVDADYTRFIILADARTGSTLLGDSLNTSPRIICFQEIFNYALPNHIGYHVEGYDNGSTADRELRDRDFEAFLRTRVYCQHAKSIGAVGFKLAYPHVYGFEGLLERFIEDHDIRVVHLQRRNLLRKFVSLRIALRDRRWVSRRRRVLRAEQVLRGLRNPIRAIGKLPMLFRPLDPAPKTADQRIHISPDECREHFEVTTHTTNHYNNLFKDHPLLTVFYEDLVTERSSTLREVQTFLGVKPARLKNTVQRQNPEPLSDLIENYDELKEVFRDTPYAEFFE